MYSEQIRYMLLYGTIAWENAHSNCSLIDLKKLSFYMHKTWFNLIVVEYPPLDNSLAAD